MDDVIVPTEGNICVGGPLDGRKLLLIFGNRTNSTLVKYLKKDAGFAYANWCREWHQISAPRRDSLNPRGKLVRIVFRKEGRLGGRKYSTMLGMA